MGFYMFDVPIFTFFNVQSAPSLASGIPFKFVPVSFWHPHLSLIAPLFSGMIKCHSSWYISGQRPEYLQGFKNIKTLKTLNICFSVIWNFTYFLFSSNLYFHSISSTEFYLSCLEVLYGLSLGKHIYGRQDSGHWFAYNYPHLHACVETWKVSIYCFVICS